jgi:DNA polymerase-3 subunit gamma/tau
VSGGGQTHATATTGAPSSGGGGGPVAALAPQGDAALARYPSFDHVIELIRVNRDVKLLVEVETTLQLAQYQPGRIEFVPTDAAPADLAQRLGQRLQLWTGNRWAVTIVNTGGAPTIAHLRDAAENALKAQAQAHPLVQAVLAQFPKARITDIRTPDQIAASVEVEALPEVDDEWDPFEDG